MQQVGKCEFFASDKLLPLPPVLKSVSFINTYSALIQFREVFYDVSFEKRNMVQICV